MSPLFVSSLDSVPCSAIELLLGLLRDELAPLLEVLLEPEDELELLGLPELEGELGLLELLELEEEPELFALLDPEGELELVELLELLLPEAPEDGHGSPGSGSPDARHLSSEPERVAACQ